MKKCQNLTKMLTAFDIVTQIQYEVHFWIALINTFRLIYNLFGFSEVRISPLFHCLGNDIIMTPFLVTWFSNLHILCNFEWTISLPSFNSVGCLWQVLRTDSEKHNDDVIVKSFHVVVI